MKVKPLSIPVLFLCLLQSISWNSYGDIGETVMFPAERVSHPDAVNSPGQASSKNNKTEIGLHLALFDENIKWLISLLFWSLFLGMLPNGFSISFWLPFPLQVEVFLCLWMWLQSLQQVMQRAILCEMKKSLPLPSKVCLKEGFRCCFAYRNIRRTRPRSTGLDGGMQFVSHKEVTSEANKALLEASSQGHIDAVRELLQQGVEVNTQDNQGCTALHKASWMGHTEIVRELLQHGAEVNLQDKDHRTALHEASWMVHTEILRELLQHGAEVNTQDKDGCTALFLDSWRGHMDSVRKLLQHGAEVNTQDKDGWTALHVASRYGHTDIVRELLLHGAEVNTQEKYGKTALYEASNEDGHTDTVRELLLHGADVNMQEKYGKTALHVASKIGHMDIVRELLLHGAKVNTQDQHGDTALYGATSGGHTDIVRELLQHGAEVNTQDKDGWTALHEASKEGHTGIVRELLLHGAEVNTQDKYGCTALHEASRYGHTDIVRELLVHGTEVNKQEKDGSTALYWASKEGRTDTVRELLLHGAKVNTQRKDGYTALHWAIRYNYSLIVELLLTHGAAADTSMLALAKERALSKVASLLAKQLGDETEAAFLEKGRFYPVFVCTVEAFLSMPNIMKHEEALMLEGCIVMLPVNAVVVFFSHRWLSGSRSEEEGGAHPDRDDAYKCHAMQKAIKNDFPDATHVWVDFLCVPQRDPDSQLLAINSLPYIVRQCAHFVVLHGISEVLDKKGEDEASFQVYNSRGWCRLECLSALAPLEEGEQEIRKWRLNMDTQTVENQPSVFEKDLSIFNPFGEGSFFFDNRDRNKIALMVYNLANRFVENDFGIAKSAVKFLPEDMKEKYKKEGRI